MARLALFLLGPLEVKLDGESATGLATNKVRALLAYLAVEADRPHRRETLAGLLWPDWPEQSARTNLRNALANLRKAIGDQQATPSYLHVTRETLQFNAESDQWVDVIAFGRWITHAEPGSLEKALALYRGAFLEGFSVEDSADFEDWIQVVRERLQRQMLTTVQHLVEVYEGQGKVSPACELAWRWVELAPWQEQAHQALMRLLALSGQRGTAMAQYEACRRALQEELDVEPGAETVKLYEQIRDGTLGPPQTTQQTPSQPMQPAHPPASTMPPVHEAVEDHPPAPPCPQPVPSTPSQGAAPIEGERRMVTALVARIKGAAALAEQWDVEAWTELMDHIFQILSHEVQRYDGEVDQYRQGGLVALFGVPIAHEDDPERAVLAALAMPEVLRQIDNLPETLALQVGIDTGEVVILPAAARDASHEGTVRGLPLTLAARLAEATDPRTVLVAEPTYRRVAPLFDWQPLGRLQVQGVQEPLALFRVLAHKDLQTKGRGIEGLESPLVGRDAEFNALQQAVENVCAGLGGIVTVVGEAGIGKSRLVAEIKRSAISDQPSADVQWIEGRCLSYATNEAYQVWLDMLHAWLDAALDADPTAVRATLRERVARVYPDAVSEVYPFLVRLLSLPSDAETTARLRGVDAEGLQVLTFRAVETLIESAARRQPLILVCEDLHWADPTSLALLERLLPLTDHVPLLLLCIMRPVTEHTCWRIKELATRDYRHRYTDLWLEPLSPEQSSTLVGNLLHIEALPPELRERILTHAEGNPFFLEEILRSLIEDDAIAYDEGARRWRATREIDTLAIPDTLHGVLSARIDRLPPPAKRVLQLAAVIGRTFSLRVLEAITVSSPPPTGEELEVGEHPLESHLITLQRAQLIRERARLPEREYIFKHVLTQEAAYNGLLKRERRAIHRHVAETLEQLYPERIEDQLGLLAHHWEQGGDAERALPYLRQAGEQAAARYANAEAVAYFSRALDLLPADRLEERLTLLLAREDIYRLQGAREEQRQDLKASQDLAEMLGDQSAQIIVILRRTRYADGTGTWILDPYLLQKTLSLIETQDVQVKAQSYLEWGRHMGHLEDYTTAQAQLEKAIQLAHAAGLKAIETESLRELGLVLHYQGGSEQAIRCLERSLQLSREIGNRKLEGIICNALAYVLVETGNDVEAQRYAELGIRLCRETGNRYDEGYGADHLATIAYHQGAYTVALYYARQAMILAVENQAMVLGGIALLSMGQIFGDLGQYEEVITYCERVLHDIHETHNPMRISPLFFTGLYAHYLGDDARAQACGEEIIHQALGEKRHRIWGWVLLGHALTGLGQLDEAATAYQHALEDSALWGNEGWRIWLRAGLIRIALLEGETTALQEALPRVEEILCYWETDPVLRNVPFERFETCWTCYRLLQALQDPRAPKVLERTYNLVQATAAKLQDPEHRRMFMENVAVHREIIAEWERVHTGAS